jgi:glycosyltransferase involved in cell wall biosynthesis
MTADTIGGVWEYSLDLSRSLASAGIEVTLATMGREPSSAQRADASRIPSLTLKTSTFTLEWMPDARADARDSGRWLLDLQDAVRPDIIHLNGFCHGSLPWAVPVLMVAHSCVLSWWESVRGATAPPEWNWYRTTARQGLLAADCVVAPSRWMADEVERLYGVRPVFAIANGRDGATGFSAASEKQHFVLAAGRLWDPAKNVAVLDRACVDLPWPVYLAGATIGPHGERFVAENGVALGTLTPAELAAWMREASIYALPAKYEPFGLSALEAAMCGCALVLGDIPSLRENWEDAALFFAPDDHRALRRAMDQLISSPAARVDLGRRAGERAQQFTTRRMGASYLAAYAQLLKARRAPKRRVAANA